MKQNQKCIFGENMSNMFSFQNFENPRLQFDSPMSFLSFHVNKLVETKKNCVQNGNYGRALHQNHPKMTLHTLTSLPAILW